MPFILPVYLFTVKHVALVGWRLQVLLSSEPPIFTLFVIEAPQLASIVNIIVIYTLTESHPWVSLASISTISPPILLPPLLLFSTPLLSIPISISISISIYLSISISIYISVSIYVYDCV